MIPKLEAIKKLFLAEWDPIGVAGIPDASDEYDGYAMHVSRCCIKALTRMQ